MPICRPARTLAAACLVAVTLFGAAPHPAAALEPPRPLPDRRPTFVTETDTRPWIDCLWASAAMLADKWTNGEIKVTHGKLRRLSGDTRGGSSLEDMQVAFRKLGLDLPLNERGDSTLSWDAFLARLRKGAGAVVLGDDGQLPHWFGRWDRGFWKKEGKKDNHAVYVERYDRKHGRVWIMDPLARGPWRGEWISVAALHRFAWFRGGSVVAVTTPTAKPAPFAGVVADHPQVGTSSAAVTATWRLRAPRRWRYPGADVHVTMTRIADPVAAAIATAQIAPQTTTDPAPARPVAGVAGHTLRLSAAIPTEPGVYTARLSLADRRFGSRFVASAPVAVFVPGARRATMRLTVQGAFLNASGAFRINLSIANTGEDTWGEAARPDPDQGVVRERSTRVIATWVRLDAPALAADTKATSKPKASAKPKPTATPKATPTAVASVPGTASAATPGAEAVPLVVELRRVPLAPGNAIRIRQSLAVPEQVGRWALVIDIVDDVAGSFSSLGSAPVVALFEVVPPRGIEAME